MPELPEVEVTRRDLQAAMEKSRLIEVLQRRADLRRPLPPRLSERLRGRNVLRVRRRAKYILCDLEKENPQGPRETLLLHLGMSGRILIDRIDALGEASGAAPSQPDRPHEHLVFTTETGFRIGFVDPRRFGMVDLYPTENEEAQPCFARSGIEPLDSRLFTPERLEKLFSSKRAPIKTALLDQSLIAGLGNIYVCEALFQAGIHPAVPAGQLDKSALHKLWQVIPRILHEAVAAGGSTLRDYRHGNGEEGGFQKLHQVYGREGEPCLNCGKTAEKDCGTIQRIVQGGRSTFFCAVCQPEHSTPHSAPPAAHSSGI
ncbi:bifunctional DNA-formamidopyrimidine glycosylase/DNA-(apurinic or apyrimidinic site) lyase [Oecophyllibacter saccharovorans]|uniref:bifunctional DNA-formamidopyrimidine glycosylase/DNA-(apurinic or apyrimidinic site) lyase n=1 Tax=Oecophyllibacter saccharovorans TaxID=2558360 RepID=UPI001144EB5C|nr:bifunctional DNA-formamidopyrimidine glycosylase/DNA-(apurinic or apyrimidinic site) lyase [Oecophyllibacter saccharovorans]QDH15870.1 bifunctional DNA-formamidopyrimidine glycosylase/DNA-(apurinic or apyrimidinic site) lyase [Oecophyllibacter saccharovorans]